MPWPLIYSLPAPTSSFTPLIPSKPGSLPTTKPVTLLTSSSTKPKTKLLTWDFSEATFLSLSVMLYSWLSENKILSKAQSFKASWRPGLTWWKSASKWPIQLQIWQSCERVSDGQPSQQSCGTSLIEDRLCWFSRKWIRNFYKAANSTTTSRSTTCSRAWSHQQSSVSRSKFVSWNWRLRDNWSTQIWFELRLT